MRRGAAVTAAILLALGGYAAADVLDVVPGVLTRAPLPPKPTPTPSPSPSSGPSAAALPSPPSSGMPVTAAGTASPVPTESGLRAALGPVLADPALAGAALAIRDGSTGAHLLDVSADAGRVPASATKLLSAAAIDSVLPGDTQLVTRVVQGSAPERIVLVAGGDMLLAPEHGDPAAVAGRAGLSDLADSVAAALRAQGRTSALLAVDPAYAPGALSSGDWPARFLATGITGPVAMLGLSTHRAVPDHPGAADPVAEVAATLAARLAERGVATQVDPAPAHADPAAAELGSVRSAPITQVLRVALQESDNALTESLARQAAFRAGKPTDFHGVGAFVRDALAGLGVDVRGVSLQDASGLAAADTVPARVLVDVLLLAVSGHRPGLAAALESLPVAGLSGTLADRFEDPTAAAGVGLVRAKTGTLKEANTLTGTVVTADGRLLVFTVLVGASTGTAPARLALDRVGATLASCGCR